MKPAAFQRPQKRWDMPQSTVTFHIQAIEDHYHQQLFNRTGKGAELTEFGKDLLEHIDELLNSYEAVESFSLSEKKPRSIRIGAPESLMMYRLYHIIKQYKQTYPNVEIVIMNDNCAQLRDRLNSGDLDLCFFAGTEIYLFTSADGFIKERRDVLCCTTGF